MFVTDTDTLPLVVLAVVFILLLPELPDHPPGRVQLYDVAPFTAVIEYVFCEPLHTFRVPAIVLGVVGVVSTVTTALPVMVVVQ